MLKDFSFHDVLDAISRPDLHTAQHDGTTAVTVNNDNAAAANNKHNNIVPPHHHNRNFLIPFSIIMQLYGFFSYYIISATEACECTDGSVTISGPGFRGTCVELDDILSHLKYIVSVCKLPGCCIHPQVQ